MMETFGTSSCCSNIVVSIGKRLVQNDGSHTRDDTIAMKGKVSAVFFLCQLYPFVSLRFLKMYVFYSTECGVWNMEHGFVRLVSWKKHKKWVECLDRYGRKYCCNKNVRETVNRRVFVGYEGEILLSECHYTWYIGANVLFKNTQIITTSFKKQPYQWSTSKRVACTTQ